MRFVFTILVLCGWSIPLLHAQYFGQNKPSYEKFNFQLYKTPNFELYHYFKDEKLAEQLGKQAEKWYFYHQQVLLDTFQTRNPIIFYSNHADFQQTTAVSSRIDVGTGGVTEGMKRRVVMPVSFTGGQTDHVLGHELVHAFQYHMLSTDEEVSLMAINNIPLWMIEGMAEYLSLGSVNSHTALWMRDALINNTFPSLREMTFSYRYSPYRYGHAFWAYIAYQYGEQYIPRLFKATARVGYEQAIGDVLMLSDDSLSVMWQQTLKEHLLKESIDSTFTIVGERIISKKNSGRYNLNPSISPNGRYVVFLSERDMYDIDLFMADGKTGEVVSRLYTATSHDEIDALNYLETSGTWSPDSRYFAFIAFKQGQSTCQIYDVQRKHLIREIQINEVDEISWPAWSTNSNTIAFSALKEGVSDIILYNLDDNIIENITQNEFACIQPAWSPDGQYIYYVTDKAMSTKLSSQGSLHIARVSVDNRQTDYFRTFDGAKNLNPIATINKHEVLFLSNRDGRRNLYLLNTNDSQVHQITNYPTGIIGMTDYSPALTLTGDTLLYTMLWNGEYSIFKTSLQNIRKNKQLVIERETNLSASRLLPHSTIPSQIETNLYFNRQPHALQTDSFFSDKIRNKFKLDYIGNASAGVMTGRFGTGMAGSIEAMFSDILSKNMLYTSVSINGEIYDFGGQIAYITQRKRMKFGVALSHIPYRTGSYQYQTDSLADGTTARSLHYLFRRTFEDKLSVFTFIPINKTRRFEVGASYAFYNYRIERIKNINSYSQIYSAEKEKLPAPDGFGTGILDAAYVIDNAKMGLASPVEGKRLRIQVEHYLHKLQMQTLLIDFRRYVFIKPYSLAFRLYHYGRYGKDSDSDRMSELFLGSPWFVRGYDMGNFYGDETTDANTISMNQLIGTRLLVTNLEWRIPFTGPKEIGWFRSNFLFSELALFVDGGVSWNKHSYPVAKLTTNSNAQRIPVFSGGVAYRINLFGAMILEPYYGFPFHQNQLKGGEFGINIFAGW
ncbi:PD40 domain-containing protein [Carboxylicivirga sediminis]|uniref:PD40 domain-containing protein n=1 Tax=Carboxylicivirga sediminis TaxID=2006564 RepID=A0A941F588_9BACT|nr:basic secretory protein-like protein [Carboxylicivirga sediminis]MBR8537093.1 PD40 domain-containing protein [Carboxylicivirga sediminis]